MANETKKRYVHKIYNGATYVATLADNIVMNKPSYGWSINGGMGEMVIDLALSVKDFRDSYENNQITFGYRVKTFVQGADEALGTQIYDGLITTYDPIISAEGREFVRVHVVSMLTQLENKLLKSGANTEVPYASADPQVILKDIIDKNAGNIGYSTQSVAATGTVVSYTFSFTTCLEAVKKALELCPAFWYWYLGADSTIYLSSTNFDTVAHKLYIGKQVQSINAKKSIDKLKNALYFKGGGSVPLYKLYERTSSITAFGRREDRYSDERVTLAATAQTIATKILDENDHPISTVQCSVVDNSIDTTRGYDIESLKPGDIVQILFPSLDFRVSLWSDGIMGATWDVDFWDYDMRYSLGLPMQIQQVNYGFDRATLELTARIEDVTKRIEDVDRNLNVVRSEDIPTAPS